MNTESRTINATRNILWGYIASFSRIILEFVLRTVFIQQIGSTYLGVNGLYTNVLGILSLSELGIGTSMNFSLYRPVAENDTEKIKSLMKFYCKAYRIIAMAVAVMGIVMIPFLPVIIKNADSITQNELIIYYLIYLFNTVTSYCVSYKYSLVNAYQHNYIITKIEMYFKCITIFAQIIVLFVFKNFLMYLLIQALIGIVQKIFLSIYIDKKYPILRDRNVSAISEDDKKLLKDNVKGTLVHKLGEAAIYQTDNIIISSFISITLVGYVSNYTLVINAVATFTNAIFNSLISGYGNFIVKESRERQEELLYINQFLSFVIYGFVTVCLFILIQPFITVWLGAEHKIDNFSAYLMMINVYFSGERLMLGNYKTAAGIFLQDRWITVLRSILNIVLSVVFVKLIGLPGIYLGTVIQGIVGNLFTPAIVYKNMFNKTSHRYYLNSLKYLSAMAIMLAVTYAVSINTFKTETVTSFVITVMATVVITGIVYLVFFWNNKYFLILRQKASALIYRN
ncbi:MAG: lipopolysaccharide biosynthesis protein [Lachnospiraceae bacterium]